MNLNDFDIKSKAERGTVVTLTFDGEELDGKITVVGSKSERYRDALRRQIVKLDELKIDLGIDKLEKLEDAGNEVIYKYSDATAVLGAEFLADITLGWEKFSRDDEALEFTKENAVWLYRQFDFIAKQVDEAAKDDSRFLARKPAN